MEEKGLASQIKIGSHVSMAGEEMFLGSVKEALSYGANTFMLYTGAPQNTTRKPISELRITEALALMKENGLNDFVVHAPYIINLANTVKPEIFALGVQTLADELARTEAMTGSVLVLHPGAHVGEGVEAGTKQIVKGLNEVLTKDTKVRIALETMAGKGSEIGRSFEELARILDGVTHQKKLCICFDTCHTHDAGYDIINHLDEVLEHFDRVLGKERLAVFHINDSMNPRGAAKDRHANIGQGNIGLPTLRKIVHLEEFVHVPKILETPYVKELVDGKEVKVAPYKREIEMLR